MPVNRCSNGKYRIGNGKCIYDTKAKADRAYKGYLASKYKETVMSKAKEIMSRILEKIKKSKNEEIITIESLTKATVKVYLGTVSDISKDKKVIYIDNSSTADIEWDIDMSLPLPNDSVSMLDAQNKVRYSSRPVALMNEIHRVVKPGGIVLLNMDRGKKIVPPASQEYNIWNTSTISFYVNDKLRKAQSVYPKFTIEEVTENGFVFNIKLKKVKTGIAKSEDLEKSRGEGKGQGGSTQGDGGADKCVCPDCGKTITHDKGEPCNKISCPACGASMIGKSENTIAKNAKYVEIVKTDDDKQIVTGVVLQPEIPDSDKDVVSESDIEEAMYKFMESPAQFDVGHDLNVVNPKDIILVENYLAPVDIAFKKGKKETKIKKGSWIMGVKLSDGLWKDVKSGKINGFSPWGTALREYDIDEGGEDE